MHHGFPRAPQIGLLYLRYVGNPKQIWDWFMKYIRDTEVGDWGATNTHVQIHMHTNITTGVSTEWPWAKDHHHWCICTGYPARPGMPFLPTVWDTPECANVQYPHHRHHPITVLL